MDVATPRAHSSVMSATPRRRGPIASLRIETPSQNPSSSSLVLTDSSAPTSALSPVTSDSDSFIFPPQPKPRIRNMKKLSLTLPSPQTSSGSLAPSPPDNSNPSLPPPPRTPATRRRPSVISLPATSTTNLLIRKGEDEDGSPSPPYLDGPLQILPGVWLGSEDNARDWKGLIERGVRSVLNVAKEVSSVYEPVSTQPLRPFMSTPDLHDSSPPADPTYVPAHLPSGRPAMHYLKLPWSHGQSDLVRQGFPLAMSFVDQSLERGDGVLIHCQCGVSRSATLVIALVMRAAAQCSPSVPPEVWALKGMQGAYTFVKEKSKWVSPNMSLIYQLLDYERTFKTGENSPATSEQSSGATEDEEWGRRRQMLDEETDQESEEIQREARALDKAMEDRLVARKSSQSSIASSSRGMGLAWRNKYGNSRKRTGSIASIMTSGSIVSEHLVEEDEEQELLGVGGGFTSSTEPTEDEESSMSSGDPNSRQTSPCNLIPRSTVPPPSAPAFRSTFSLPPPPATAFRATFDLPPSRPKGRRRPPPLQGLLPTVPSSPITPVAGPLATVRPRNEGRKPDLPPAHLRKAKRSSAAYPTSATPSQTLFVFPPSPTNTRTPSTMTLTSSSSFPFPMSLSTPRVSTFEKQGRRRSFIGVGGITSQPTTASTRVDARGWVGLS